MRFSIWPPGSRANADAVVVDMPWEAFTIWLSDVCPTDDKDHQGFSPLFGIGPGPGGRVEGGPASFVVLEYDDDATPDLLGRALEVLRGRAAILYTTASATAEHPRFRVVLRMSRVCGDAEYRAVVREFGRLVGVQPVDSQRTRLWYRPILGCVVRVFAGEPWVVPEVAPEPPRAVAREWTGEGDATQAMAALLRRKPDGAFAAACICRDYGLDEDQAVALIEVWGRSVGWKDFDGVADRVANAYVYARGEPGAALAGPGVVVDVGDVRVGVWECNDSGNADRLLDNYGADLRWSPGIGWLRWLGDHWDPCGAPVPEAEQCARAVRAEGLRVGGDVGQALAKWGLQSGNVGKLKGAIEIAQHRAGVQVESEDLDLDPWLLGVEGGVVDLRTGEWRGARREDLMTKRCDVRWDARAQCPRFDRFVLEVMGGDQEMAEYLVRFLGAGLSGAPTSRAMGVWWGEGRNGKSTILRLLGRLLGSYAHGLSVGVLTEGGRARNSAAASPDLAALRGVRLATCVETDSGMRWNESMIKQLTGGDRVTARGLWKEPVEFDPTWTLVLATNHKPVVRGTDAAIWDRIQLVPWLERFEGAREQVRESLDAELWDERAGVLRRLVAGCRAWQAVGVGAPAKVRAAVAEYREDQDVIGAFLGEQCVERGSVEKSKLYREYKHWAGEFGQWCHGKQTFNRILVERGVRDDGKRSGRAQWVGLSLARDAK